MRIAAQKKRPKGQPERGMTIRLAEGPAVAQPGGLEDAGGEAS